MSDPLAQLRACIASGVSREPHQVETTRLLIELHPYVLRQPSQLTRWQALFVDQAAIYRDVLERGQSHGVLALRDSPDRIGADFIALEDGYSGALIAGTLSPDHVEQRLWTYATVMCGAVPR